MQRRTPLFLTRLKTGFLVALCLLPLLFAMFLANRTVDVYAYTAAQRPELQPTDIALSRERILRSAKAHIDRANETGYTVNNILKGTEYLPLATSNRGFVCVDLVTHVLYTATASKINGRYHSITETLATRHAFANSNGIVFDTSGVGVLRQQLTALPQLYTRYVAPIDITQLRLGDIVISGDKDSARSPTSNGANKHATLVIGKVTPEENEYLKIPNYNPDTSYFISMSSLSGARWVSTNWYNRDWNMGDPNKGYFISNLFRMRWEPSQQDYGGFRIKKVDATNGAGLKGAEFDLRDPNGEVKKIVMTSSEYVSGLEYEPGIYTLTETKAPDGYTLDPTPRTIEIEMDKINSVYWDEPIANAPSDGFVRVTKKDAVTGANVAGAVFELSQSSAFPAGSTIRLTTRADGTTIPQRFGIGAGTTVYVREVSVPAPYLRDPTVKRVTLIPNQTVGVTFENHRARGRLEIVKQGANNTPVQGAIFEVRNASNALVATLTTDAQGKAQTGLLPLGTYTVTETFVPAPYILDPTPITMTLTYKDMNTPVVVTAKTVSNDAARGRLEIVKQGANNTPVQGAIFEVKNASNALVATLTTDAQGKAQTGLLSLGTYTVTETFVPAPYILDSTPITMTLTYKDMHTPVVVEARTISNDAARGRLEIAKLGANNAPVQGAIFEVRNVANALVATLTTDAQGKAQTELLPLGTYTVMETFVPAPYILDSTPITMTLTYKDMNTPVVVTAKTVSNDAARGRLEIVKQGANNAPVQGAIFEVRNASNALVTTLTTDAQGKAQTELLPLGTYTVTETFVPTPYILDPTPITMTLTYKDMNTPVVVEAKTISNDAARGRLEIVKQGANNVPVQGAIFEVRNASNALVATLTTDAQGKAQTGLLPLGMYTVTETFVPAPYILDPTPITMTLTYKDMNTPVVVTAKTVSNDAARGRLEIVKQGANNTPIQGAIIEVRNAANVLVATLTTDAQGKAQTGLLPLGTYTVTETFVPAPYILDPTPITMTLAYKDMNTPIIVEARTVRNFAAEGRIKIVKKDSINQEVLAGAIFEIRDDSDTVFDTITTDASGVAISKILPLGDYTVKEIKPPAGFVPNDTVYNVTVAYKDANTPVVEVDMTIENEPIRGKIRVIKLAQGEATPIEGATFELFNPDDTPAVDLYGNPVGTLTTDSDGMALTPYLRTGTYILRETGAPEEFYISDDDFEVKIVRHDEEVTQYVRNERIMLRLRIIKSDSATDELLHGAEFQIYDSVGDLVTFTVIIDGRPVTVDRLVTNDDGIAISAGGLPIGTYSLREVKAPDGYASIDDITFEITRDTDYVEIPLVGKTLDVRIGNVPTVIELSKRKITGDGELPGAHLQVIEKESGAVVEEWVSTDTPHVILKLKVGVTYILRETLSPAGYTMATDVEFTVLDTGEVQPVVMRNKLTRVEIHKQDKETGEALEGVELQIQDKGGNAQRFVYDSALNAYVWEEFAHAGNSSVLTTNAAGTILIYGLHIGEYELSETKESPGYKRLRNPIAFTVKDNSDATSPVVIDLENEMNEVTLEKTDLVTGNPVVGAVIQIFDEAGELVREVSTDENGQVLIKGLPAGTYTFREVLAPEGYILNEETFTFIIDEQGNVTGVTEFINEPTSLTIVKEDRENGQRLEGATFELYRLRDGEESELMRFRLEDGVYIADATGDLTSVVSNAEGTITILRLPYGDYRLVETKAPKGYDLNEKATDVTLSDDGETLIVTLLNEASVPPVETGENFPLHAMPFFMLTVICLSIVLYLGRRWKTLS